MDRIWLLGLGDDRSLVPGDYSVEMCGSEVVAKRRLPQKESDDHVQNFDPDLLPLCCATLGGPCGRAAG